MLYIFIGYEHICTTLLVLYISEADINHLVCVPTKLAEQKLGHL